MRQLRRSTVATRRREDMAHLSPGLERPGYLPLPLRGNFPIAVRCGMVAVGFNPWVSFPKEKMRHCGSGSLPLT
jgi:hypothetical protein